MGSQQSRSKMYGKKWHSDFETLQLLDEETNMSSTGSFEPVTSISFFDCHESDLPSAETWITARVTQIATANRWIVGRLVHATDTGRKSLAVPSSLSEEDLERLLLKKPKMFCPSRSMSPTQLTKQYAKIQLPYKLAAYDKEDVFVCRFVFAHTPDGFCIVFSMSHTIGDGNTFYNIMNQLSATEEVRSLEPKRKLDYRKNVQKVLGRNSEKELGGLGFKVSMLLSTVGTVMKRTFTKKKARVFTGLIDGEQIAKLKADAQSRGTVDFVSTNDIITSAFTNAAAAQTCLMAFNLRERMSGLTESHAGNYVDCMMFDATNAATPDRIRQALQHPRFRCRDGPVKMFSRCCLITNWASFSKPIHIPGCVEQAHQPLMNPRYAAYLPLDVMIVFRAGGQRLGAYWMTPRSGSKNDVLGGMPFALDTLKCSEM